jgi:hypothetical protein
MQTAAEITLLLVRVSLQFLGESYPNNWRDQLVDLKVADRNYISKNKATNNLELHIPIRSTTEEPQILNAL